MIPSSVISTRLIKYQPKKITEFTALMASAILRATITSMGRFSFPLKSTKIKNSISKIADRGKKNSIITPIL
jgi:hypothetical protein